MALKLSVPSIFKSRPKSKKGASSPVSAETTAVPVPQAPAGPAPSTEGSSSLQTIIGSQVIPYMINHNALGSNNHNVNMNNYDSAVPEAAASPLPTAESASAPSTPLAAASESLQTISGNQKIDHMMNYNTVGSNNHNVNANNFNSVVSSGAATSPLPAAASASAPSTPLAAASPLQTIIGNQEIGDMTNNNTVGSNNHNVNSNNYNSTVTGDTNVTGFDWQANTPAAFFQGFGQGQANGAMNSIVIRHNGQAGEDILTTVRRAMIANGIPEDSQANQMTMDILGKIVGLQA